MAASRSTTNEVKMLSLSISTFHCRTANASGTKTTARASRMRRTLELMRAASTQISVDQLAAAKTDWPMTRKWSEPRMVNATGTVQSRSPAKCSVR